ncbi:MAG: response regulator [Armatimonadetes bacterium]|nr:response regulator [Armatimonadota bacterium]
MIATVASHISIPNAGALSSALGLRRVLVVDSNADHVELIARAFRGHSRTYRLISASAVAEARVLLAAEPVDLILADEMLPDGEGIDLLPNNHSELNTPLVLMTAHLDHSALVTALKRGAVDCIVKSAHSIAALPDTADRILREWSLVQEQRRMQEALDVSRRRALSLFEHSPIALWEEDCSAVKQLIDDLGASRVDEFREMLENQPELVDRCLSRVNLIAVNQAAQELLGAETTAQVREEFRSLFTDSFRECFKRVLSAMQQNAGRVSCETKLRTFAGETREIQLRWAVVPGHESDYSRVLVSLADITQLRQTQRLLEQQKTELQRSNEELQQFAYIASHDLQEPLRMISSYLQLLERRYGDQLDQDARDFIGFAVDGAKRMRQLITDLLAYSRVSNRGNSPDLVDSGEVLAEALHDLSQLIADTGANVEYDQLPVLVADRGQLGQLFRNLLANAMKFCEQAPRIQVSAQPDGENWVISVRDNGIGIAPEHAERIFLIFQRLHSRAKYPGTGIGLAICKRIVERHGGRLWVESTVGEGSVFRFTLPGVRGEQ